jgi:protease IV
MVSFENGGGFTPPPPPQTIIIERPERKGFFRRILWPVLVLVVVGFIVASVLTNDRGLLPSRLHERYVAGELSTSGDKIAIVDVEGMIIGESVEHAIKQIHQARDDKDVKAVILRVDSPGGTVSGSDRIWREVEILKGKKPVVASMGSMAASGGYYVSAPADAIFAEPTTMTGSIGVIAEFPQVEGLLKKVGVEFETITTGEWKDSGSMYRHMTTEERTRWREVLDDAYQRFVRVVAQGRKLPLSEVISLANGKVYTAHEAKRLKLVTDIGYLDDAINDAKTRASLSAARVIRYTKPLDLRAALLGMTAPQPGFRLDPDTLLRFQTPQILMLAR